MTSLYINLLADVLLSLNSQDMITWYYFSPLVFTHFLKHLVGEFGVRSTKHSLPEKFEYTYYLFGGYRMDTFLNCITVMCQSVLGLKGFREKKNP